MTLVAVGETAKPLEAHVSNQGVGPVTGETLTLKIRNGATTNSYLDFNDNTFKTSGWTTQTVTMTEIDPGVYQYIWNTSLVAAITDGFIAVAQVSMSGGFASIAAEEIIFRDKIAASVAGNVSGNVTGSVGSVLGNVNGSVAALGITAEAQVNAQADQALVDYDPPTHAELISEINSVQSDIAALNDLSAAQVNAEADQALVDAGVTPTVMGRLDVAVSSRVAAAFFSGMTSILNWMRAIMRKGNIDSTTITEINATTGAGTGTYDATTDSLEAIRDNMAASGPSAAAIADAVWDEALSGHQTAGSAGKALSDAAAGGGGGGPGQGDGSVTVDHNTGGTDNLRYVDPDGAPIDNAQVRAYLKADWDAQNRSDDFVIARVTTAVDGRWALPMFLDPETYTFVFNKQQAFGPADTKEQVVS